MKDPSAYLQKLWQRGCDYLGCEKAIMGGAMTWVSERHLVSALSNAGAFGVLACGAMTPDLLRNEIRETQKLTQKPFGVNLIVMHPQLEELAQVCIDEKVPHVVLAGGLPPAAIIAKLKAGGAKVMGFAPALVIAKKLIRSGIDALVIEGSEAGGHIGPVSTFVLAQEILPEVSEVPIFLAGGIGRGEGILALLEMGASGVQLGTRFVCAKECIAHPAFKQAFLKGAAREAQASSQLDPRFPVIPVRALLNDGTRAFMDKQREVISRFETGAVEQKAAQLEIEHFWAGALRRAVMEGDVAGGSLMAGQSVGMVSAEQPVSAILDELINQALAALGRRAA
ncbi:MAG TPA: nitronate monooxygenase [Alphaproteobacteria bacterium]|nr:nitronate monooxygenase [Alphaproteobacteria bacterium]